MKLHRVITLLREENIDLREKVIDIETDYVILNESYKNFIAVSKIDHFENSPEIYLYVL